MTFKMEAADAIATLVETALPRFSGEKKLLYVPLEVEVTREESSELGLRRSVHFLFHRPGNYTTVMMLVTDNICLCKEKIADWKVTSCHDSCWRADGVESPLSQLYAQMSEDVHRFHRSHRSMNPQAIAAFPSFRSPQVVEVKNFVHDRDNFVAHIEW